MKLKENKTKNRGYMSFFTKNQDIIGLDISNTSCKLVQLRGNSSSKPQLITYGALTFKKPGILDSIADADKRELVGSIKELFEVSKATSKKVVVSLPSSVVFNFMVSFPYMEEDEVPGALRWEVKHYIPLSPSEVRIAFEILKRSKEENKTEVFCLAVPKYILEKYQKIIQEAGLELIDLEIEPFAIIRTLVLAEFSSPSYLILDIGGLKTEITIVENNRPFLTKTLTVGGDNITSILSEILDVDYQTAENFKKEYGIDPNKLKGAVPKRVKNVLNQVLNDTRKILDLYRYSDNIKNIFLTGGTALLPGLPEYLAQELGKEIVLVYPWHRIAFPPGLESKLGQIGPLFSVSCGLALKNFLK